MGVHEILRAHAGVVRTTQFPSLRSSWHRQIKSGTLIAAFPGVVMDSSLEDDPFAWMRAIQAWNPNAVVAGAAAARLTFEGETKLTSIRVYASTRLVERGPIKFCRRSIEADLLDWAGDLRVTGPDATAISAGLDGDFAPGTTALRLGLITPETITETASRWSAQPLAALRPTVKALRSNPWSVAEVDAHRLFRETGIIGWVANPPLTIRGRVAHPDIAFLRQKIAFEVNGFEYHSSRTEMERDAERMNLLIEAGWKVYVLTPSAIRDAPIETAEFIQRVLPPACRRGVGGPGR